MAGRKTDLELTPAQAAEIKEIIKSNIKIDIKGCWIWQGKPSMCGYGQFSKFDKKTSTAHVWSYAAWLGKVPAGYEVGHNCDVRLCCNPDHLNIITHMGNMRQAAMRGRLPGWKKAVLETRIDIVLSALESSPKGLTVADLVPVLQGDYQRAYVTSRVARDLGLAHAEWITVDGSSKKIHLLKASVPAH